nr:GFA family protein [Methylorubrum zatmanii]
MYRHRSEGSGRHLDLHFCPVCGTTLFMTFERFPACAVLMPETLDDPAAIEVRPDNAKQVFVASARPEAVLLPASRLSPGRPWTRRVSRTRRGCTTRPRSSAAGAVNRSPATMRSPTETGRRPPQPRMKARMSALSWSALTVSMPCGRPG